MGGPCWILKPVAADSEESLGPKKSSCNAINIRIGRFQGPACTDNFQIANFKFRGHEYYSVEQCFQAMKFPEGSTTRSIIQASNPRHGESSGQYGHRVWKLGQSRDDPLVDGWTDEFSSDLSPTNNSGSKCGSVETMCLISLAKFAQYERFQRELVEKTADFNLDGGHSTANWQKWNGCIMKFIRATIKQNQDEFSNTSKLKNVLESIDRITREDLEKFYTPLLVESDDD